MNPETALQKLGINKSRSKIYLTILSLKKASVIDLSRKTGILRTTVYDNLRFLKDLGLISEIIEGKKRLFVAEPPTNLNNLLNLQKEGIASVLPDLTKMFEAKKYEAKIRFYEGTEGVKRLHEEFLLDNKERVLNAFGEWSVLREYVSDDYTKKFTAERARNKISNKVLLSGDKKTYEQIPYLSEIENIKMLRKIKITPPGINFEMFVMFFDNKTMFFAKKEEGYCFVFESKSFTNTIRTIFNTLWQISEPFNS